VVTKQGTFMNDKKCIKCQEVKSLEEFYKSSHIGSRQGSCKMCANAIARKRRKDDPETMRNLDRKWRESYLEAVICKTAKCRAKKAGIPFDIRPSDIVIPETCPVLEVPLSSSVGVLAQNSPSLDRIIPELGYVNGNIMVISHLANVMKNNTTWEQCVLLGRYAARQIADRESIRLAEQPHKQR